MCIFKGPLVDTISVWADILLAWADCSHPPRVYWHLYLEEWPVLPVPAPSPWPMLSTPRNYFIFQPPSTGECTPQLEE